MIDLSYKKPEPKTEEPSTGIVILGLLPFAALIWWVLTSAFIGGIF